MPDSLPRAESSSNQVPAQTSPFKGVSRIKKKMRKQGDSRNGRPTLGRELILRRRAKGQYQLQVSISNALLQELGVTDRLEEERPVRLILVINQQERLIGLREGRQGEVSGLRLRAGLGVSRFETSVDQDANVDFIVGSGTCRRVVPDIRQDTTHLLQEGAHPPLPILIFSYAEGLGNSVAEQPAQLPKDQRDTKTNTDSPD